MIKLLSTIPLPPKLFPLFPQNITHNNLAWHSPTPHIHWEIAIFVPPAPPPKPPRKIQKLQLVINLLSAIPLFLMLHPLLQAMISPDSLYLQSPNPHIHWETAINISKSPQTPKNPEKMDWWPQNWWPWCWWWWYCWFPQCYWKRCWLNRLQKSQYSLIKCKQYFKSSHNTKKSF